MKQSVLLMSSRSALFLAIAALALPVRGLADFSYTERSQMTGGSMLGMMKTMSRFSKDMKKALEPRDSVHRVKGMKMSTEDESVRTVTDVDAETITMMDLEKKEYSVITFDEMRQAMLKMAERMGKANPELQKQKTDGVEAKWNVDFRNTGQSKEILGINTREGILTVEAEAQSQNGQKAGAMKMESTLWMGELPISDEMNALQSKMAQKLAGFKGTFNPALMQMGAGGQKGMEEMAKKMAEMKGTPLHQVVRIGFAGQDFSQGAAQPQSKKSGPGFEDDVKREAKNEAEWEASRQATRALGGRFGGIGSRLGRRGADRAAEKAKEEPKAQPETQAAPAGSPVMMEMTTEFVSFSQDAVDPSVFAVPAGFKQVEHPMKKALK